MGKITDFFVFWVRPCNLQKKKFFLKKIYSPSIIGTIMQEMDHFQIHSETALIAVIYLIQGGLKNVCDAKS